MRMLSQLLNRIFPCLILPFSAREWNAHILSSNILAQIFGKYKGARKIKVAFKKKNEWGVSLFEKSSAKTLIKESKKPSRAVEGEFQISKIICKMDEAFYAILPCQRLNLQAVRGRRSFVRALRLRELLVPLRMTHKAKLGIDF